MLLSGFPEAQPAAGFAGGLLIGLAAALMLLGIGRIAGISGMTARATGLERGGTPWATAALFVIGLLLGAAIFETVAGPVEARFPPHIGWLLAGGVLVGFGARLGSGCTSGHGVCGVSRLSRRSLLATAIFMASGIASVALVNALGGGWS
ncbi:YeeE/YedE family protein [Pacificimonas sp. ICDLI1SI03]